MRSTLLALLPLAVTAAATPAPERRCFGYGVKCNLVVQASPPSGVNHIEGYYDIMLWSELLVGHTATWGGTNNLTLNAAAGTITYTGSGVFSVASMTLDQLQATLQAAPVGKLITSYTEDPDAGTAHWNFTVAQSPVCQQSTC